MFNCVTCFGETSYMLRPVLVPFIHNHGPGLTFQHGNARPHTAALTRNVLQNAGIPVMAWPSLSADMNPIEHVWDELGRRVRNRVNASQTLQALEHALVDEWRRLPVVFHTIAEINEKTVSGSLPSPGSSHAILTLDNAFI